MSAPLCLACGQEVRLNRNRQWETRDGSTDCPSRSGGHLVRQIIPDPPGQSTLTTAHRMGGRP